MLFRGRQQHHPAELFLLLLLPEAEPACLQLPLASFHLQHGEVFGKHPAGLSNIFLVLLEALRDTAEPVRFNADIANGVTTEVF